MGHLVGLSPKNYEIFPPQVEITFFTLFYTYIILHGCVKQYKWNYFQTYIILHNIKYIYPILNLHQM
jgi:hypothetical protein